MLSYLHNRGVTFHSLLVTRCKITRYSLQNSLVTCCRSCSLQKFTRYALQNSLVTRCRSCSLQKFTRYSLQNSLVTRCRSCSLQKITRYSLQNSLVTRCKNSLVTRYEKTPRTNVYLKPIKLGEFYLFILYFQLTKNRERFRTQ